MYKLWTIFSVIQTTKSQKSTSQNTNTKSDSAKIKAYPNDRYFSTEYKLHSMYTKKIGKCISNRIKVQVICHGYLNIVCFIDRNTGFFFGEIDRNRKCINMDFVLKIDDLLTNIHRIASGFPIFTDTQ